MVGALVEVLMTNSAPSLPYDIVVPSARDQSELAPFVKSVVRVVPRASSAGHEPIEESLELYQPWRGRNMFTVCKRIAVRECLCRNKLKSCQEHSGS